MEAAWGQDSRKRKREKKVVLRFFGKSSSLGAALKSGIVTRYCQNLPRKTKRYFQKVTRAPPPTRALTVVTLSETP